MADAKQMGAAFDALLNLFSSPAIVRDQLTKLDQATVAATSAKEDAERERQALANERAAYEAVAKERDEAATAREKALDDREAELDNFDEELSTREAELAGAKPKPKKPGRKS